MRIFSTKTQRQSVNMISHQLNFIIISCQRNVSHFFCENFMLMAHKVRLEFHKLFVLRLLKAFH